MDTRPQPPGPPGPERGRRARILTGVILGAIAGFAAPFLPSFFAAALFGADVGGGQGLLYGALMLITIPAGAIFGGLWAARRRRPRRKP